MQQTQKLNTSLYDDILIGDFFPENWLGEFSPDGFFWQDLLNDENRLFNLYVHSLKDNARALRTPTTYCSAGWLRKTGHHESIETLINLCVSKAMRAREELQADVLISGSVGPVFEFESKNDTEIRREIEEPVVYLTDFGVDSLLVQNIESERLLRITLECIRSVTGSPLAVFFSGMDFGTESVFQDLKTICEEYQVELCGLQIPARVDSIQNLFHGFFEVPLGFLLESIKDKPDWETLKKKFAEIKPLMVVGGKTLSRKEWREFIQFI